MAKKYLLHRISREDADYIEEDTRTRSNEVAGGNCYLLVNKNNGKIFRENGSLLIYKAMGLGNTEAATLDENKRRFIEAVEACAYFRGYANTNDVKFKTSKISELLYELEDHEIEIPEGCNSCKIVSTENVLRNQEVIAYIIEASTGYDILNSLQRNLPTLALFINEAVPEHLRYVPEEDEIDEEMEEDMEEEWEPF